MIISIDNYHSFTVDGNQTTSLNSQQPLKYPFNKIRDKI